MKRAKDTKWIYGRDGTMVDNDYKPAGTATAVRLPGLAPYLPKIRAKALKPYSEPNHTSNEPEPAQADSTDEDTRVKLVETCLQRAKEYLAKNDPMQASEKLYKAAEESIKFLAEEYNLSEFKTAQRNGMWSTGLLSTAPTNLSTKLGKKEIAEAWAMAFLVHVMGFHENRLSLSEVKYTVPYIEELVKYVWEVSNARRKDNP